MAKRAAVGERTDALPFLKWVGGKRTLLDSFAPLLPPALAAGQIHTYCEPFLGGGAVFLSLASRYSFERIQLMDINPDLVLTYQSVRDECEALIAALEQLASDYFVLEPAAQEARFKEVREIFNQRRQVPEPPQGAARIDHAADFIFLNKTCYGGMFRVNKSGGFNVPFGKHKRPQIVHPENLRKVSALLAPAVITEANYESLPDDLGPGSFVYFDPPYRPLSATASFTSYHGSGFNDDDQQQLAALYRRLDAKGVSLMLSNSDPMSEDPSDRFFETLYEGYQFHRVGALRKINSNIKRRGRKAELVITNQGNTHTPPNDPGLAKATESTEPTESTESTDDATQTPPMEQLSWL